MSMEETHACCWVLESSFCCLVGGQLGKLDVLAMQLAEGEVTEAAPQGSELMQSVGVIFVEHQST
jgi:hypothetical protein